MWLFEIMVLQEICNRIKNRFNDITVEMDKSLIVRCVTQYNAE